MKRRSGWAWNNGMQHGYVTFSCWLVRCRQSEPTPTDNALPIHQGPEGNRNCHAYLHDCNNSNRLPLHKEPATATFRPNMCRLVGQPEHGDAIGSGNLRTGNKKQSDSAIPSRATRRCPQVNEWQIKACC